MSASTLKQPRYYGGLFNLEHRVMSGAVVALAVIVLVLVGQEGRADPSGLQIPVDTPAAEPADDAEPDGWVKPAEIRAQAPSPNVFVGDLDEWLLTPVRLLKPPQPAVGRRGAAVGGAGGLEPTFTPARPAAVEVGRPDVAAFGLGESLVPAPLRARRTDRSAGETGSRMRERAENARARRNGRGSVANRVPAAAASSAKWLCDRGVRDHVEGWSPPELGHDYC